MCVCVKQGGPARGLTEAVSAAPPAVDGRPVGGLGRRAAGLGRGHLGRQPGAAEKSAVDSEDAGRAGSADETATDGS